MALLVRLATALSEDAGFETLGAAGLDAFGLEAFDPDCGEDLETGLAFSRTFETILVAGLGLGTARVLATADFVDDAFLCGRDPFGEGARVIAGFFEAAGFFGAAGVFATFELDAVFFAGVAFFTATVLGTGFPRATVLMERALGAADFSGTARSGAGLSTGWLVALPAFAAVLVSVVSDIFPHPFEHTRTDAALSSPPQKPIRG